MRIQSMFQDDINRKINGVVKVDQDEEKVLAQELNEYVITRELKKHFRTFFNAYEESFAEPTADIGVWISGFFGSGKSHFLKMLSYLLANKEVEGERTIERFRRKFQDDPAMFMFIDNVTRGETDTVLFNIDIEGSINKDKTAVLRVFAKMFYNYLGYYGENLKVAKLEQFIDKQGRTEAFRKTFEEKNGSDWISSRDAFAFFEDDIVETLVEVLGMSKESATNWFNGEEQIETSIAQLVSEMKEYVATKPDDFRLLFMVDEMGQYVGGDTDLLLNLQSLLEKIGSECGGKVWVVCTGQEAIDEIIKARENEFSRIQARFKTRLSLSSSSADEVIQKRILAKTPEAEKELGGVYSANESVLRNLFSFDTPVKDIKGFGGTEEFTKNFPFVPYQFILMQKVFTEIRKHGNSGKHLSGGERSMLSGFQEAAQKIEEKDEYTLAPFYLFYDTVHTFLDSSIRSVIERAERAATERNGLEKEDVDLLKLLYLIRYTSDDVKANLENIVILMADDIRADKIAMKEKVRASLDRLESQNYIGRTGDTYQFLTDEEQDIQREIKNVDVPPSEIQKMIGDIIFLDIYSAKKFRYGDTDFAIDEMVDTMAYGSITGGMPLKVLSVYTDPAEKSDTKLMMNTAGQAVISLAETRYNELIEKAMKIRKFVKSRNVSELPASVQQILRYQQEDAGKFEQEAADELRKAIEEADFYVDKEHVKLTSGDAKKKMDQALEYLVTHVYNKLSFITKKTESDADIRDILDGYGKDVTGEINNKDAVAEVEAYLDMQSDRNLPTVMSDVQSKYQGTPYGWKEIDVAAVIAQLVADQKVTVRYGGETVQPTDPRLPDMLRKKSEVGKTYLSKRQEIPAGKIKEVREFLRDYFDEMDVPEDEDGLIAHIIQKFSDEKQSYEVMLAKYENNKYPGKSEVISAIQEMDAVLAERKDNLALIEKVIQKEDDLYECKDRMQNVEGFFKNQMALFNMATNYEEQLRHDRDYIEQNEEAHEALNQIRLITMVDSPKFDYKRIPELNGLLDTVKKEHGKMLDEKRTELYEIVRECMAEIHTASKSDNKVMDIVRKEDAYYADLKERIAETGLLSLLEGLMPPMWQHKDAALERIEIGLRPEEPKKAPSEKKDEPAAPKKVIKTYYRQSIFPAKTLTSEDEVDAYVEQVGSYLKKLLSESDGIKIN